MPISRQTTDVWRPISASKRSRGIRMRRPIRTAGSCPRWTARKAELREMPSRRAASSTVSVLRSSAIVISLPSRQALRAGEVLMGSNRSPRLIGEPVQPDLARVPAEGNREAIGGVAPDPGTTRHALHRSTIESDLRGQLHQRRFRGKTPKDLDSRSGGEQSPLRTPYLTTLAHAPRVRIDVPPNVPEMSH